MVEAYYDLCIRFIPDDEASIEKFISLAKHFGFVGAGITEVANKGSTPCRYFNSSGFDLVHGIEICEDNPSKLHSLASRYSRKADIVIAQGGADKLNRSAIETAEIDILSLPLGIKEGGFDHVIAKAAADRGIALEFDVGTLIRYRGGKRVHAISELEQRLMLARKFEVNMVLTSAARSIYDMRGPRELAALASLFGMTKEEAIKSMTATPTTILKRKRRSNNYIMDGVELIEEQICPENQEEFC